MKVKILKTRIFHGNICEQIVYNVPEEIRKPKDKTPEQPCRKRFQTEDERRKYLNEIRNRTRSRTKISDMEV